MKFQAVVIALTTAWTIGCSGPPPRVPVKALVKIDGQPVEFCAVCFYWADPNTDLSRAGFGRGVTEKDGSVIVKDMYGQDGMYPGRYKVTFEKYVAADGQPISTKSKPSEIYGGSKNMLPKKYHSPETTDVIVDVPTSGLDRVFELTSK